MGAMDNLPKTPVPQKGGRSSAGGLTSATVGQTVMFATLIYNVGGSWTRRTQTREERARFQRLP